jgi:leucyl aminopeptidase
MLDIAFNPADFPTDGALALLIGEGEAPTGLWRHADEATGGGVGRALAVAAFKGGKTDSATLLAPGAGLSRLVAIGLGPRDQRTAPTLEQVGGRAVGLLAHDTTAALDATGLAAPEAASIALGAVLRAYRFDRYRTREKPEDKPKLTALTILVDDVAAAEAAWAILKTTADAVFVTRDVVSEPPNILNPAEFARRIEALAPIGLTVETFGPAEMANLGFGALLGVAMGSVNEARMVVMRWQGAPDPQAAPVAFIGKGVTFDSGGISIKPAAGMEDMKWDMAGAGAVVGAMAALAGRKARVNAVGLVGLVENMPSGTAQRPSDIVTTASGQTVEIINTDAEGRMVLADVLWYAQDRFHPIFMVDLATLTGGIIVSLGHEYAGLFCNNDELATRLTDAGAATEEKLWRMPLGEAYDKQLKSDIADMKHVTGRPGGSITAAQFLQRFTNNVPWAHLDIAGTAWSTKDAPCIPKGATAYGVRLLDRLVADHYES